MSEHTVTPWVLDQYGYAQDASGSDIRVKGFTLSGGGESVANTARIIACVNACEGLSNNQISELVQGNGSIANYIKYLESCLYD